MKTETKPDYAPLGALLLSAFVMGCSPVMQRLADVGPFASAFWRLALALPILYLWARIEDRGQEAVAHFPLPVILSGLTFGTELLFWHWSVSKTSVANATFFATTAPVWVILVGFLFMGRRVASNVVAGLLLCLLGGAALVWQSFHFAPERLLGDVFGCITALFFGLYFLCLEAARKNGGAARITFETSLIGAAILFVAAWWREPNFFAASLQGWLVLLGLAWLSHIGGQGLLIYALGRLPATFSSLVIFLEAVAAAGLAWLVLGEQLSALQLLGGALILAGIFIARPRSAAPPDAAPAP